MLFLFDFDLMNNDSSDGDKLSALVGLLRSIYLTNSLSNQVLLGNAKL
jgi:hypothetical protein